jgi:hypothetical protein
MSMTSNSRVERNRLLLAIVGVVVAACAPSRLATGDVAPDSPRPPRDVTGLTQPVRGAGTQRAQDRPVEISSVRLRLVRGDSMLTRLAGPELMRRARDPVAIDVTTAEPLGDVTRTASPEIYVDGARLSDTWPLPPNRLIAFAPDVQRLRAGMTVAVAWLGSEERTRSRRPVALTDEQLRQVH